MIILLVAFGGFGTWAALAQLSVSVIASGTVSVESFKRTVQHLEGGIVSQINVEDGDHVQVGDVLLVLDGTQSQSQLDIARSNWFIASAQEARLLAEQQGADSISFYDELQNMAQGNQRLSEILDVQSSLFLSRRSSLQSEISALDAQIQQFREQIDGLQQAIDINQQRIQSLNGEIDDYQSLFREGLGNNQRIRELERQVLSFASELANARAQIAQLYSRISENRSRIEAQRQNYQQEIGEQLRQVQSQISESRERIVALHDLVGRTELIAPVSGTVVGLDIHTVGAVIRGGEPIMSVVPDNEGFIVEARIPAQDIDNIYPGQTSEIRFSAFNQRTVPVFEGVINHVSADSFQDENTGVRYYRALLQVSERSRERMTDSIQLLSGMPAEVMIHTGEKTLFAYLTQPVTDMLKRAIRQD
ncbi:HlyD family type I secretion periplasmic adaptor subunit [Halomonas sp. SpR8]|uniref:HlyD family type I secretion periplasmic adaptor subunit n=1 Tax=Halomonas sp. SpR8 TaxID=3050463 RepID=UPI0027E57C47|nr:HlyD family type I secretion periplasmic adaptor subunit [Halomonas sp. SpR8]MDQ7729493.1 HlyD family type I secretion periplasmic adaptor subunit [Halomonas sp. SpR8]